MNTVFLSFHYDGVNKALATTVEDQFHTTLDFADLEPISATEDQSIKVADLLASRAKDVFFP